MVGTAKRDINAAFGLAIVLMPFVSVWFLLKDGYSTTARVLGFLWLGAFLLIASHGHASKPGLPADQTPQQKDGATPKIGTLESPINVGITSGIYEKISPGVHRYSKLAPLIGTGELSSSSGSMRVYLWNNGDGSGMTLGVDGDRIVSKAQVGLY